MPQNPKPGGTIRTISVSLIAIAAVAASVVFTRGRQPRPVEDEVQAGPVEGVSLDAIRQAGF